MSGTTCSISILLKNKTIQTITTNYDGYISHSGVYLIRNYDDVKQIQDLIDEGCLSALDAANTSSNQPAKTFLLKKPFYENCRNYGFNYLFKEDNCTWYLVKNKNLLNLCEIIDQQSKSF